MKIKIKKEFEIDVLEIIEKLDIQELADLICATCTHVDEVNEIISCLKNRATNSRTLSKAEIDKIQFQLEMEEDFKKGY